MTPPFPAQPHAIEDLWDGPYKGFELRDEGMARARHAADPRTVLQIDKYIAAMNASGVVWSCNDIRKAFPVVSSGLVGDRVNAARMRKEMERVGQVDSSLKSTHGKPIATWRGVTS